MKLHLDAFPDGAAIPPEHAFCIYDPNNHVAMGSNRNPRIAWSEVPAGTQSLALIIVDVDVPSVGDDVNQEGKTVPKDLPRVDFYHLVLVDIDPALREIPEGGLSGGITPRGKDAEETVYGWQGRNDYTDWFSGDPDMEGTYGGYDGPCPPWNDERLHHYHFKLYALDAPTLGLVGDFSGQEAMAAMQGHILAEATHTGTYTLNPALR